MSRIALVIADTSQHVLARNAFVHSMRALRGLHQLLIYSDRPDAWAGMPVQRIAPIGSLAEYNRLITKTLAEHLDADFALVVQYDGFVLDGGQFSPHFLHYDYIGAPWPHFTTLDVGNGGFSWRSRRLVEAVARLPYDGESEAEDLFICRRMRPTLESEHGVRFAPRELARHFAVESVPVPWPTFGFHGVFHLPQVYRERIDFLLEHLSPRTLHKWQPLLRPAFARVSPQAAAAFEARLAPAAEAACSAGR